MEEGTVTWARMVTSARFHRHLLRAIFLCHHAQHWPTQPQRPGQTALRALRVHEPRHQQWQRPARGAAEGENAAIFPVLWESHPSEAQPRQRA